MCRKVTHHKGCGHVTAKFQHRPCKHGSFCPRIVQELSADDRCVGCLEDAETIIERPIRPIRDYQPRPRTDPNNKEEKTRKGGFTENDEDIRAEQEFRRQESEWFRRYTVDSLFDEASLTAQYMDQRTVEVKDSRKRRAERADNRHSRTSGASSGDVHEADSFQWVPKKWWKNIWKWRTRPAMFIDGENGHSALCGCCRHRRVDFDDYYPRPTSPFYYSLETGFLEVQRPAPDPPRSPELLGNDPLTHQAIESLRLDHDRSVSFDDDRIPHGLVGEMKNAHQFGRAESAPEPQPSILDCGSPDLKPSCGSLSRMMSPIPHLDISDDGSKATDDPSRNHQILHFSTSNLRPRSPPTCKNVVPSAPRDFFPDSVTCSSDNAVPHPDTPISPKLASSQQLPNSPSPGQSFAHDQEEDPWERLNTLARLAVAEVMAIEGDQETKKALDTARSSDIQSKEFLDSIAYLSQIDYRQPLVNRNGWHYTSDMASGEICEFHHEEWLENSSCLGS
ncbi:hypothetical protein TWF173_005277 [Orbilia oligospora]|nr:hypothetical protein TWF173_005277 [Orbilia oligospora]